MQRRGFTLIEVLIAIILIAMIVPALFETTTLLRKSNKQLKEHLDRAALRTKALQVLYDDIASSDGNITIRKDEFDRLCIAHTAHSLYHLSLPSVCWGVSKSSKTLVRLEGVRWPLRIQENGFLYADEAIKHMTLFEVSYNRKEVIVALEAKGMEPVAFAVYGITPPPKPKPKRKKHKTKKKKAPLKPKPKRPLRPKILGGR